MNANMNENRYVRERRWAIILRNVENQQKKETTDSRMIIWKWSTQDTYWSPHEKKIEKKKSKIWCGIKPKLVQ